MSKKTKGTVLKTNKALGMIWHPDTGLVFKSKDDKIVVGQCVDDELVDLDENMVELCKEWHFKYDEALLKKEEVEEDAEEVEEEEEVEEVEEVKPVKKEGKKATVVPEKEEESEEEEEEEKVAVEVAVKVEKPLEKVKEEVEEVPKLDTNVCVNNINKELQTLLACVKTEKDRASKAEKSLEEKTKQLQVVEKELVSTKDKLAKIMSLLG